MGMNINLTPQLEDLVRQKVASGLYTSASEVVREALRLMEEKDRLFGARLDQLRQDIREGLESGQATAWDSEEIKRAGRARVAAKKAPRRRRGRPISVWASSFRGTLPWNIPTD
jgi:antitoxin ParD1/3/4